MTNEYIKNELPGTWDWVDESEYNDCYDCYDCYDLLWLLWLVMLENEIETRLVIVKIKHFSLRSEAEESSFIKI